MVARLTPDQKAACSNHVGVKIFFANFTSCLNFKGFYNLSGHMVWLGNRTRGLDEAHVEYLRGIENPIGIKIGPPYTIDETLRLIETLNPTHEAGKIVLITRFGKDKIKS